MKLNIGIVTKDCIYPLNAGGSVAVYYRIKELSKKGHNIYLFLATSLPIEENQIRELKKYCKEIKIYLVGKTNFLINLLKHPLFPYPLLKRFSKTLQNDIEAYISSNKINLLMIEYSILGVYFPKKRFEGVKNILVLAALSYKSLFRLFKTASFFPLKKIILYIEAYKIRRFEYKILKAKNIHEFWFYSVDDINDVVEKLPDIKNKIKFIPIGVESKIDYQIKPNEIPGITPNTKMILNIGNMQSPINVDSAVWFARKIFPKVKCEIPNAKFCIIGKYSKQKLNNIASEDILLMGEVQNLIPYLSRCDLYVVPLRSGAGIRVKLLDGLSAKKIVLTTSIGVEAIEDIKPNIHFLLAKDEEEFANKSIDVLKNPEKYKEIAENGYNFFKENFSVEVVGNIVEKHLLRLTGGDN